MRFIRIVALLVIIFITEAISLPERYIAINSKIEKIWQEISEDGLTTDVLNLIVEIDEEIEKFQPDTISFKVQMAEIYSKYSYLKLAQAKLDSSEKSYQLVLKYSKKAIKKINSGAAARWHFIRGQIYLEKFRKYAEAITEFESGNSMQSSINDCKNDNYYSHPMFAEAYLRVGDYEKAFNESYKILADSTFEIEEKIRSAMFLIALESAFNLNYYGKNPVVNFLNLYQPDQEVPYSNPGLFNFYLGYRYCQECQNDSTCLLKAIQILESAEKLFDSTMNHEMLICLTLQAVILLEPLCDSSSAAMKYEKAEKYSTDRGQKYKLLEDSAIIYQKINKIEEAIKVYNNLLQFAKSNNFPSDKIRPIEQRLANLENRGSIKIQTCKSEMLGYLTASQIAFRDNKLTDALNQLNKARETYYKCGSKNNSIRCIYKECLVLNAKISFQFRKNDESYNSAFVGTVKELKSLLDSCSCDQADINGDSYLYIGIHKHESSSSFEDIENWGMLFKKAKDEFKDIPERQYELAFCNQYIADYYLQRKKPSIDSVIVNQLSAASLFYNEQMYEQCSNNYIEAAEYQYLLGDKTKADSILKIRDVEWWEELNECKNRLKYKLLDKLFNLSSFTIDDTSHYEEIIKNSLNSSVDTGCIQVGNILALADLCKGNIIINCGLKDHVKAYNYVRTANGRDQKQPLEKSHIRKQLELQLLVDIASVYYSQSSTLEYWQHLWNNLIPKLNSLSSLSDELKILILPNEIGRKLKTSMNEWIEIFKENYSHSLIEKDEADYLLASLGPFVSKDDSIDIAHCVNTLINLSPNEISPVDELNSIASNFDNINDPEKPKVISIRQILYKMNNNVTSKNFDKKECIMYYYPAPDTLHIFCFGKGLTSRSPYVIKRDNLYFLINEYNNRIKYNIEQLLNDPNKKVDYKKLSDIENQLFTILFPEKIKNHIKDLTHINFVVNDTMKTIPFGALKSKDESQYLIRFKNISLNNGGSAGDALDDVNRLVILANTEFLVGKKLINHFDQKRKVTTNTNIKILNRDAFILDSLKELSNSQIPYNFVIIAHLESENVDFGNNCKLPMESILRNKFGNLDLAILVMCSTENEKISISDKMYEMGASSFMGTLWRIISPKITNANTFVNKRDINADFLIKFIENLERTSKEEAFSDAIKQVFLDNSEDKYRNPRYWAPLVLIMDPFSNKF